MQHTRDNSLTIRADCSEENPGSMSMELSELNHSGVLPDAKLVLRVAMRRDQLSVLLGPLQ